jgi:hypothetical protein
MPEARREEQGCSRLRAIRLTEQAAAHYRPLMRTAFINVNT